MMWQLNVEVNKRFWKNWIIITSFLKEIQKWHLLTSISLYLMKYILSCQTMCAPQIQMRYVPPHFPRTSQKLSFLPAANNIAVSDKRFYLPLFLFDPPMPSTVKKSSRQRWPVFIRVYFSCLSGIIGREARRQFPINTYTGITWPLNEFLIGRRKTLVSLGCSEPWKTLYRKLQKILPR